MDANGSGKEGKKKRKGKPTAGGAQKRRKIKQEPSERKRPNEGADDGPAKKKAKYQKEVCYRMDGEVDHKNNSDEDPDW